MLNNEHGLKGEGRGHLESSPMTCLFSQGFSLSKEHGAPLCVLSHPELSTPCPGVD